MQRLGLAVALVLWFSVFSTGCHTMRFEFENVEGTKVTENKSFYFFALTPRQVIDVREKCPHGAAAILEERTFVNGLLGGLTLGIYTPRRTTYYCLDEVTR